MFDEKELRFKGESHLCEILLLSILITKDSLFLDTKLFEEQEFLLEGASQSFKEHELPCCNKSNL